MLASNAVFVLALFEVEHSTSSDDHAQAQSLSKYCAYLVAIHPELLPEYQESTELVFKDMMLELSRVLGFWRCYFSTCVNTRYNKIMGAAKKPSSTPRNVVKRGAELAHKLVNKAQNAQDSARRLRRAIQRRWLYNGARETTSQGWRVHHHDLDARLARWHKPSSRYTTGGRRNRTCD